MPAGTAVGAPVVAMDDAGDTVMYSDDSDYFDIGDGRTDHDDDDAGPREHGQPRGHDHGHGLQRITRTLVTVTITVGDMSPGCTVEGNNALTTDCEVLLDAMGMLGGSLDWSEDNPIDGWEGVTVSGDEGQERVTRIWLRGQGPRRHDPGVAGQAGHGNGVEPE